MRPLVVLFLLLVTASPVRAATAGPLSVHVEATVGEVRDARAGVTEWSLLGRAFYRGLAGEQTSPITLYDQSSEPVPVYSFVSALPSKVDIGGLERDETFVCGILAVELGGPCVAIGPVVGLGSVRIAEHDLRPGGRLDWQLDFPRAVCLRCLS